MQNDDHDTAQGRRPLRFALFTTNSPSGFPGSPWSQPLARDHDYRSLDSWMDLARKLEAARFDTIFWADHSGVYDTYEGSRDATVRQAVQFPINDPSALVSALATVTEHLGFAFSANVIQEPPFSFARRVATLDHLTKGRVAWNIVTSFQMSAWRNVGHETVAGHAERYARAADYVDVVYKLLEGSWEDRAVVRDLTTGIYADPSAIHSIDHVGEFYSSAGPAVTEPSPQRLPVLFQAGSSSDGRAFAARNAEAIFIGAKNPRGAASVIDDMRARVRDEGRHSDDLLVFQQLSCIVGRTEEEAKAKAEELRASINDEANLAYTSATMGLDLSAVDLDTPIGQLDTDAMQGKLRALAEAAPDKAWTFREVVSTLTAPQVVGTGEQIADYVEAYAAVGVTGMNVAFLNGLGELEDFTRYAVPELQRRGLMQTEYLPGTLREKWSGSPRVNERHPAASYRRIAAEIGHS
ncbi:LLM class flavin-dependent oxidoreductase [Nocardioides immobilis]|uniref:LLM class flavin-dependent oxidoreductase n=1 Tax=Nocardioides immobilis TaxID=2049295 RepID=A0A417Y0P2_9ACTN|nr:NtaA/DmoA family FMN-dependent monooxygenase [Nocardioides immobilis]RHW26218.1 LLM class flavin-dependent oxidoreductase [Nocardioides immobilis]